MSRTKGQTPFNPTDFFELHDIALWTTSLTRDAEYQPALHAEKCHVQTMQEAWPELYMVSADDEEVPMLRVLVTLGVRSIFRDDSTENEFPLFKLEATFAVDYFFKGDPPEPKHFNTFVNFNCVHNAWPFWRQHVYDTLKRASLPVPAIPLFAGKPSTKKRRRVSALTKYGSALVRAEDK